MIFKNKDERDKEYMRKKGITEEKIQEFYEKRDIFPQRLKQLRQREKMTQSDLCEILGFSRATLSAYENGTAEPTLETLQDISDMFNVSLDWLCTDKPKLKMYDEIALNRGFILTYAEIIKYILNCSFRLHTDAITENGLLNECSIKCSPSNSEVQINIKNEIVTDFFTDFGKMYELLQNQTLNLSVFNVWLNGKLDSLNYIPPENAVLPALVIENIDNSANAEPKPNGGENNG